MLADVRQKTIQPVIEATVAKGALVHTDEYGVYARLPAWGYRHKTVCHGRGEYARDEDGDGFCEIHVNTMEGTWSLLRSWLRPHRGISQEKLPLYLGFFEFVHNARHRGKALLGALVAALVDDERAITPDHNKSHHLPLRCRPSQQHSAPGGEDRRRGAAASAARSDFRGRTAWLGPRRTRAALKPWEPGNVLAVRGYRCDTLTSTTLALQGTL
jgi:transposase-like protein